MKAKKAKSSEPSEKASKKSSKDSRREKPIDPAKLPDWVETGDCRYFVRVEGIRQGAIIWADSRAEAREKYLELSGITSCERKIKVEEVDEDHGYTVDANGVIDPSEL